jgi:hypothetical protein
MKMASNKAKNLQQIIDDDKQYKLSSVIAAAKREEAFSGKKYIDKTMKDLMRMERDTK